MSQEWVSEKEIFHWLRSEKYSTSISNELASLIAGKYNSLHSKGYNQGLRKAADIARNAEIHGVVMYPASREAIAIEIEQEIKK